MSVFDVDQATFDQWRESGQFVLFGEGERPKVTEYRHEPGRFGPDDCGHFEDCDMRADDERCRYAGCSYGTLRGWVRPPAAFVEAAQACETCGGSGTVTTFDDGGWAHQDYSPCPDCTNDKRRWPVTVPCRQTGLSWVSTSCADLERGRLTVAHATVEWGPLPIVEFPELDRRRLEQGIGVEQGTAFLWTGEMDTSRFLTLPPDVDPATLIGQWAIGGSLS